MEVVVKLHIRASPVGTDDGDGQRGRQNLHCTLEHPHINLCFTTFRGDRDWIAFSITPLI